MADRITLLFVATSPSSQARLQLDHEYRAIRHKLRLTRFRDAIELRSEWAVHVEDLQQILLEHQPSIVHFSSHGEASGSQLFADGPNSVRRLPCDTLAELFASLRHGVRLAVFNTCFSAGHAQAMTRHIDAAIGMRGQIIDSAAIVFAAALYRAIGFGCSMSQAFDLALNELSIQNAPDRDMPMLCSRDGVELASLVFAEPARPASAPPSDTSMHARERAATLPPAVFLVPERAARFVGRDDLLDELERLLSDNGTGVALEGMPGVGKSELAIQLAHRLAQAGRVAGGVIWLSAQGAQAPEGADDAHAPDLTPVWAHAVADALGLPEAPAAERARQAVRAIEAAGNPVLIIVDNANSFSEHNRPGPLPRGPHIRLLVTTRRRNLGGHRLHHVRIEPLTPPHDQALLAHCAGRSAIASADAGALLAYLGGHPLAIALAGAYLAEFPHESASSYLHALRESPEIEEHVAAELGGCATVQQSFQAVWNRLDEPTRSAWLLAACFAPEPATGALADAVGLGQKARGMLRRFHLIDCSGDGCWHMHRLTRAFGCRAGSNADQRRARHAFVHGCAQLVRALATQDAPGAAALAPAALLRSYAQDRAHLDAAVAMAGVALDHDCDDDKPAELVHLVADIARARHAAGDSAGARALYAQAMEAGARVFGEYDPRTNQLRACLARALRDLSELDRAHNLLVVALEHDIRNVGEHHPVVAERHSDMGLLLADMGELDRAREHLELALAIDQRCFPDNHPRLAAVLANLAAVLGRLGRLERAQTLLERGLAATVRYLGHDHLDVAAMQVKLAVIVHERGDIGRARELVDSALAVQIAALGEEHPALASTRSRLAMALAAGHDADLDRAEALLGQALTAEIDRFGEAHPAVAASRAKLAAVLEQRGQLSLAAELLEQALAAERSALGNDHPEVAARAASLAMVLRQQGELRRAAELLEEAVEAAIRSTGEDQASVATYRAHLAAVLSELGHHERAERLAELAIWTGVARLGNDHPSVAMSRSILAMVRKDQGKLDQAEQLLQSALRPLVARYGEAHPDVAALRESLQSVLRELDDARTYEATR